MKARSLRGLAVCGLVALATAVPLLRGRPLLDARTVPLLAGTSEPTPAPARRAPLPRLRSATSDDSGTPADSDADSGPVDVRRVEAALERLELAGAAVSTEELADERARMLSRARDLGAIQASEPSLSDSVDQAGQRWVELRYPTGEVRYELPVE